MESGPSPSAILSRVTVALSIVAVGCGADDAQRIPGTPDPEHAREVAQNPYALTCGDLSRQKLHPRSAKLVIVAEFKLAREPALREVRRRETLNRTGRSVYYALTEICRGRPAAFEPGRLAVDAVRRGRYLAARDRPG